MKTFSKDTQSYTTSLETNCNSNTAGIKYFYKGGTRANLTTGTTNYSSKTAAKPKYCFRSANKANFNSNDSSKTDLTSIKTEEKLDFNVSKPDVTSVHSDVTSMNSDKPDVQFTS